MAEKGIVNLDEDGLKFESTIQINLSKLQTDILRLKVTGYNARQIGKELDYSTRHIESEWQQMREALHFRALKEIIEWLKSAGLIKIEF